MGVRYHYYINSEISIRKYFSPIIITIPQEDMCAVLVEIILSSSVA